MSRRSCSCESRCRLARVQARADALLSPPGPATHARSCGCTLMRMYLRRGGFNNLGPALAATVTLLGCGSGDTPRIAGGGAKPAGAPRTPQGGEVVSPNMLSAVGGARSVRPSGQVKWELRAVPQ